MELLLLLIFRLFNAALTQTYFQPDEFWQSLEVAHRLVFGYGYTTWEWRDGRSLLLSSSDSASGWWDSVVVGSPVRSVAYPSLFVPVYWSLKVLNLDDTFLLTLLPRLVQAVFAALGDWYAFRLARKTTSERTAWIFLVLTWTSPYALHTATRTFSNSLEASLTSAALFYWPTPSSNLNLGPSLLFIGLTFMIRPTSAILWSFLGLDLLLRQSPRSALKILVQCTIALFISLLFQIILDSSFFGRLTITPLSFLAVNVLGKSPISLFYGQSAMHYYFSQGIPVICTLLTPWSLIGWISTLCLTSTTKNEDIRDAPTLRLLSRAALWVTLCMSALGHKEWRFLQQLGPLWILFAAVVLTQRRKERQEIELKRSDERSSDVRGREEESVLGRVRTAWKDIWLGGTTSSTKGRTSSRKSTLSLWSQTILDYLPPLPYLLYAQLPLTAYLLLAHGRGQTQIMRVLHDEGSKLKSVGFLMPCHSTPWQAWMHLPALEGAGTGGSGDGGLAWFLSCEPPLQNEDLKTYRDQTKVFYEDPFAYLQSRFPSTVDPTFPPSPYPEPKTTDGSQNWTHSWPSHLVIFETLLDHRSRSEEGKEKVGDLLREKGYATSKRLWNGFGSDDENRWGDVLVLKWQG
ncbi:hypothetical protein CF327_g6348 [Tilletia walkeri]|nr:hypothetical protein CF327_g6348 [Tilletia walkeri]